VADDERCLHGSDDSRAITNANGTASWIEKSLSLSIK
jgi:hypothetical protein